MTPNNNNPFDAQSDWAVESLIQKGLQPDWIESECGVLINNMHEAHEKFGVSQHLVAAMPKVAEEIGRQLGHQTKYYENLNAEVEEAATLMLRQEALTPPEEIEHLVLDFLQLQMEQGDVKAAMAILAYQGHKRLSAVEERQQKQADEFLLLQQEQQRLADLMQQIQSTEAQNAEALNKIQQQLDQQKAQPQNTRRKTFWK